MHMVMANMYNYVLENNLLYSVAKLGTGMAQTLQLVLSHEKLKSKHQSGKYHCCEHNH